MTSSKEWATAFIAQARVDLQAAQILIRKSGVDSTCCMLLQMVFEKIAKAALIQSGVTASDVVGSHEGAKKLVEAIRKQRAYFKGEGIDPTPEVLNLVEELERAHPGISPKGPHLEYPWEDEVTHELKWPERDLEIVKRIGDPLTGRGSELVNLADQLVQTFDRIF